jgi:predicted transcriptional regulator
MRVPADLVEQLDEIVDSRQPSPSRHQVMLEALYRFVEREGGEI